MEERRINEKWTRQTIAKQKMKNAFVHRKENYGHSNVRKINKYNTIGLYSRSATVYFFVIRCWVEQVSK